VFVKSRFFFILIQLVACFGTSCVPQSEDIRTIEYTLILDMPCLCRFCILSYSSKYRIII